MKRHRTAMVGLLVLGCAGQPVEPASPPAASGSPSLPSASSSVEVPVAPANDAGVSNALMASSPALASAAPVTAPTPVEAAAPQSKLVTIKGRVKTQPAQSAQHAVVYLENGPIESAIDAKLDDHKMTFYPFVSIMTVGGTLTYVNSEPFPDTAFSMSNEKWDFGMVESKGVRKRKFANAGVYTILCRLHPNQLAYLVVSPSSFVVRANKSGEFVMPNVPAGNYEVVAWAPRVTVGRQSVTLSEAETTVDFDLKR